MAVTVPCCRTALCQLFANSTQMTIAFSRETVYRHITIETYGLVTLLLAMPKSTRLLFRRLNAPDRRKTEREPRSKVMATLRVVGSTTIWNSTSRTTNSDRDCGEGEVQPAREWETIIVFELHFDNGRRVREFLPASGCPCSDLHCNSRDGHGLADIGCSSQVADGKTARLSRSVRVGAMRQVSCEHTSLLASLEASEHADAYWLDCSPPTNANQVGFPSGSRRDFRMLGIMPDGAAGQRVFSGISRFPRPFIPALLHTRLPSPASAIKTSAIGRVVQCCNMESDYCVSTAYSLSCSFISRGRTLTSNQRRSSGHVHEKVTPLPQWTAALLEECWMAGRDIPRWDELRRSQLLYEQRAAVLRCSNHVPITWSEKGAYSNVWAQHCLLTAYPEAPMADVGNNTSIVNRINICHRTYPRNSLLKIPSNV
ncbi:hypothetical protein PR048_019227 [Dryococelus australis]|uniref:Uncharacterized protein n=1 Tax=Dryococelus australis TaxID=614101 RepID=A0ABQ9H2Y2_9NEOP|nr:hypothetical protein PR048_019227 [Dryococelus australis]